MSEKKPEAQRISAVPPFGLRMLPDLRRRLEDAATERGQSLNAEINLRLEQSFNLDPGDLLVTRKDGLQVRLSQSTVIGLLADLAGLITSDTAGVKWEKVEIIDD